MGFRNGPFAFDSPCAAIDAVIARLVAAPRAEPAGLPAWVVRPLESALGMVLAEPVTADRDSPAFDHSAMDGYAVRVADVRAAGGAQELTLEVLGESRIGSPPPDMPAARAAVRVSTGAPIPGGPAPADAVLKREDVREVQAGGQLRDSSTQGGRDAAPDRDSKSGAIASDPGAVSRIIIPRATVEAMGRGQHIRCRGENTLAGRVVVEPGAVLTSGAIGVLASVGCVRPRVCRPVRVAVITTGDEIVEPGALPGPFQIRNSNGPTLTAALGASRWIDVVSTVHAHDDESRVFDAIRAALDAGDAIVLSAGVSMGHRDPVRAALERVNAQIIFHGVPQRPGKPTLAALVEVAAAAPSATGVRVVPVFGLPGNPVSSLVTCTRIVLPVLGHLAGIARWPGPELVRVENDDGASIGLWWQRLARCSGAGCVELVDSKGSGDSSSIGASDGFVEYPPGHLRPVAPSTPLALPFFRWPA